MTVQLQPFKAMKTTFQSLRASLLLPQDFSLFVKWQKEYAPGSDIGQVADALEYHRFIMHCDALLSNKSLPLNLFRRPQIALECGHTVHPSDTIDSDLCPICEVTAHLAFMHIIKVTWDKVGGPRLVPGQHIRGKSYSALRTGWHMARLRFQEVLDMFAVLVAYEEDWEAKRPCEAGAARETNCAAAAIRLAQAESKYPARLSPLTTKSIRTTPFKSKKSVTFAPEVQVKDEQGVFATATKFADYRFQCQYMRPSPAYQRGIHACPPNSEYIDTSQMDLLLANVRNLKIYIIDDEDAFDRLRGNPCFYAEFVGDHYGVVGTHQLCADVFAFISDFPFGQPRWENEKIEEADRMTVLLDEGTGKVLDMFMFDGSDGGGYEDEDGDEGEANVRSTESSDWTCLRECLL